MKKLVFSLLAFVSLCAGGVFAQQNIRISYAFLHKGDAAEQKWKSEMDMKLDCTPLGSVFYSEETFLVDSLGALAFDRDGGIADMDAYNQRTHHKASFCELWHVDCLSGTYDAYNRIAKNSYISGNEPLPLPQWNLVDSVKTFNEYSCRKAEAEYLGRKWTVWYTEEIPVSYGPWLLWGCPGLIVFAADSDALFKFYILDQEYIPESRWDQIKENYSRGCKVSRIPAREQEKIKTRAKRDVDYFMQLVGGNVLGVRDKADREMDVPRYRKYEPLTAESFWK